MKLPCFFPYGKQSVTVGLSLISSVLNILLNILSYFMIYNACLENRQTLADKPIIRVSVAASKQPGNSEQME